VTPRRVLVTGGTGFLGRQLATRLRDDGIEAVTLDRRTGPTAAPDIVGDVRDPAVLRRAVRGVDAIVHTAFASPRESAAELHAVNVDAVATMGRIAVGAGVRHLVVVSSTIVERMPRAHPLSDSTPLSRLDAYRRSRIEAETTIAGFGGELDLALVRPATFVGPGQVGAFALLFDAIHRGGIVPILGPGTNRYDLLAIDDLVDALVRLTRGGTGVFHLAAPDPVPVRVLLEDLVTRSGRGARVVRLPAPVAVAGVRAVELAGLHPLADWHQATARVEDRRHDTGRARSELGWRPAFDQRAALDAAYDWFAEVRDHQGTPATTHPVPRSHRLLAAGTRLTTRRRGPVRGRE
jgi:nucleoside-diphosphate-sugar epimerase